MPSRTRAREQALQILYLMDMSDTPVQQALDLFQANFKNQPEDFMYARCVVEGVRKKKEEIDRVIEDNSQHWKLSRMARIDRNILRMGTFEILHGSDIPAPVAINEAVELGKRYGDKDSGSFVNGILDRVSKKNEPRPR